MNEPKTMCLIIEGGGFKSAFTTGILDAFLMTSYQPFQRFVGVSGGAIALSYFLSGQYRFGLNSLLHLANHEAFTSFSRTFSEQGFMDLDLIASVAQERIIFDLPAALKIADQYPVNFVATDEETGLPAYLRPAASNWFDAIIASSSLPFFTKGRHEFEGKAYIDGGCSDPIPAKWAFEQGAKDILVLRTWPSAMRFTRSWADVFGGYYYQADPVMKRVVDEGYAIYNACADFVDLPPASLSITQLAPPKLLETGTYINTTETIMQDYRLGLDTGLAYVAQQRGISRLDA